MNIIDLFKRNKKEEVVDSEVLKLFNQGSTGTKNFSGYLNEETLRDLTGSEAAKKYDQMRRSDPKISMLLTAMKNPIKAALWEVEVEEEFKDDPSAEKQRDLIEHILFKDLGGKTWTSFLQEALSCLDFGYVIFEKTFKPVMNHRKFGHYTGIKSLGFRSQKTIERWNLSCDETLESVTQFAEGDAQKQSNMDARYLIVITLQREGNNYEGIAILRPCYGPYIRKREFLKMMASGIEKNSIGIPVVKVPAGQEKSDQYKLAIRALNRYVRGEAAYLTIPNGWDFSIERNDYDATQVRDVIDKDNVEIVNAGLANFLELGQSGSGSYSLSFDLSDFFLGGLEHVASLIAETLDKNLIEDLVQLNFGEERKIKLTCSGISDKAGEELSKVLLNLQMGGFVKPDQMLEDSLRRRFGLTPVDTKTTREVINPMNPQAAPIMNPNDNSLKESDLEKMTLLAEKVGSGKITKKQAMGILMKNFSGMTEKEANTIAGEALTKPLSLAVCSGRKFADSNDAVIKSMESSEAKLSATIKENLRRIAKGMIEQAETQSKKEDESKFFLELIDPQDTEYKDALKERLIDDYNIAQEQVKADAPKSAKVIKLAEDPKRMALARINVDVMSLTTAQVNDLIKTINFAYAQNIEAAGSTAELLTVLEEAVEKFVEGPVSNVGATVQTSKVYNDSRKDFFADNVSEIVSFTWVNGDPVTAICNFLDGKTLPAGHPDIDKYWPPLHHNCKTYVVANWADSKDNPKPQEGFDVTKELDASMTLSEKLLTRLLSQRRM